MLWLKTLHILGACLFIGNILVSALWKIKADQTQNILTMRYALHLIQLTDILFTGIGVALLVITGHLMAQNYGGILAQSWIWQSYLLFIISGLLWLFILLPVQIKQNEIVKRLKENDQIPDQYWQLNRIWLLIGTLATLTPLAALYLMVHR